MNAAHDLAITGATIIADADTYSAESGLMRFTGTAGDSLGNANVATVQISVAGGNVDLQFTPVPEPATLIGVAAIGFGLAHVVRRRQSSSLPLFWIARNRR